MDFAVSGDLAVQEQLDRLAALSVPDGRFGLETIGTLLERLGNPHRLLPPVFHVAGTNGKGSTCAFLVAMLEAQGHRVHATTSPHLVRYNERIRVAGRLISDARLAELLSEVLDAAQGLNPSFFEVTIAAAFTEFARVPADACVVEVGLGGRFDATNVIERPAVCGIAALGIDHERFLLAPDLDAPRDPLSRIAFEKAGIAKRGVPLVTMAYPRGPTREIVSATMRLGANLVMEGRDWTAVGHETMLVYADGQGDDGAEVLHLPSPALAGRHQVANAGLAMAMLRHQADLPTSRDAISAGLRTARWPARLQWLDPGDLTRRIPACRWLVDGGHNPQAADALIDFLATDADPPRHAIVGMLSGKDWRGFLSRLVPIETLVSVPIAGHDHAPPDALETHARSLGIKRAESAADLSEAVGLLSRNQPTGTVVVCGSLYLCGQAIAANGQSSGNS